MIVQQQSKWRHIYFFHVLKTKHRGATNILDNRFIPRAKNSTSAGTSRKQTGYSYFVTLNRDRNQTFQRAFLFVGAALTNYLKQYTYLF